MFKELISQNLFGLAAFVLKSLKHDGSLKPERLYTVSEAHDKLSILRGKQYSPQTNYSIGMGAEACNSFCTLYEMGSFFQSLFLSAVGTVFTSESLIQLLANKDNKEQERVLRPVLKCTT